MTFKKTFALRMLFALILTVLLFPAKAQTLVINDVNPYYSGSGPYSSNIELKISPTQSGTLYYVLYDEKPSTTPDKDLVVGYASNSPTPPSQVKYKGSILNIPSGASTQNILNVAPHVNYYGYFVIQNSSGVRSDVVPMKIRILQARKGGTSSEALFYTQYQSEAYDANNTTKFPLLIFLHGHGETGNSIASLRDVMIYGPPKHVTEMKDQDASSKVKDLQEFLIVSPQSKNFNRWDTIQIDTFVNHVIKHSGLRIDVNRVYITGLSMGGIGTWDYAHMHPEKIAAIVPISGKATKPRPRALATMPIWAFHDKPDSENFVPHTGTTNLITDIRGISTYSGDANYTLREEFNKTNCTSPVENHSIWGLAYGTSHITPWSDNGTLCVQEATGVAGKNGVVYTESHDNIDAGMTVYKWLLQFSKVPIALANAGADKYISLPTSTVNIQGTATGGTAPYTYLWTKLSGTGGTLTNTTSAQLTVSNLQAGTYTFRFQVTSANSTVDTDDVSVFVSSTATRTVKIDFRGNGSPIPESAEWNDFESASTGPDTLAGLFYTDQAPTNYSITIDDQFSGVNLHGSTSTSGVYPPNVMKTAWYVNSTTVAHMTISGLDDNKTYTFKFFGSRMDASTINRTTDYKIGLVKDTLNASNNRLRTAEIADVSPVNGKITFEVDGGAGASSGLGYLNAMEMIESASSGGGDPSTKTILVDVGSSTTAPSVGWNEFENSGALNSSLQNIKYSDDGVTPYELSISGAFTNSNSHGSTATNGIYPASVMQTAWYTGAGITASIAVSGLDNSKKYSFKFFASRNDTNGTINRITKFQIGSVYDTVNASNNRNRVAEILEVTPTSGSITFSVTAYAGASSGIGYLNAFEITEITEGSSFAQAASPDDVEVVEKRSASNDKVSVYPSPFTHGVTVKFQEPITGKVSVTVRGMNGEIFYQNLNQEVTAGSSLEVNLSAKNVPKGLTLIEIRSSNGYREIIKVYKE